jgi:hypothetical protein
MLITYLDGRHETCARVVMAYCISICEYENFPLTTWIQGVLIRTTFSQAQTLFSRYLGIFL